MSPATTTTTTTTTASNTSNPEDEDNATTTSPSLPWWRVWAFSSVLFVDLVSSLILLTPWIPSIRNHSGAVNHYTLAGSLSDLALLAVLRLTLNVLGMCISYCRAYVPPEYPFDLRHRNGDKKSREELEQEALEEPFGPWFIRFMAREAFPGEIISVVTEALCIVKCLVRMNLEIGIKQDAEPVHPVFWIATTTATLCALIESNALDSICKLWAQYGKEQHGGGDGESTGLLSRVSSSLRIPLLADQDASNSNQENGDADPEAPLDSSNNNDNAEEDARGVSDIGGDANYKASWTDLLKVVVPDAHLISFAFVFLILAALCQVYIPRFLGHILDSLAETFDKDDDDPDAKKKSMFEVPGFMRNVKCLVAASVLAGVFSGLRGSLFSVVGGRVNVRLRIRLFDSLLAQDIGFFDVTKTGDITSRLSSDTTLVGDQVTLNVNVFLRSLVQAMGVLIFMFLVSWQLSIIAFISVPVITFLSRWYGGYIRSLTKLMQKKLADGNSICEAALGSMATVRSFDAAHQELKAFEDYMNKYLHFNNKASFAYLGYATLTTALPQLVYAVVIFYGGLLVRNGDMTSGQLVSFLLYLQSLSDAFASIGYIFSSLTQAVGAADKVFELMHRKPRMKTPSRTQIPDNVDMATNSTGLRGCEAHQTRNQRSQGVWPTSARGEIKLENVELYYPARPQRRILHQLSLNIEPGSIVALVGQSGGGKSSVMSLIQHLYEPSNGKVMIDGEEVHNLSPTWLSRHVSIVSQEPTLFAKSIRQNIIYGLEGSDKEPTQAEVEEAARLANAHDFIQLMPFKYDTEVGERGVQLSGGQKQRIAIARSLVRKPKILLLDEATSALDAESEHLVQQAIDDMLVRGHGDDAGSTGAAMTVVIVAHRLSTVRKADCIFVIKDGEVVEMGTHNSLIENADGFYSGLIRRQMEAQHQLESTAPGDSVSNGGAKVVKEQNGKKEQGAVEMNGKGDDGVEQEDLLDES